MNDDFERFGIDPESLGADVHRDTALYLLEQGFPLDEIRALDLPALLAKAQMHIFGPSGRPR